MILTYETINRWLGQTPLSPGWHTALVISLELLFTALLSVAAYYLLRWLLLVIVRQAVKRTPTTWDDDLLNTSALSSICRMAPPWLLAATLRDVLPFAPAWVPWLMKANDIYMCVTIINVICAMLHGVATHLKADERFATYPVQGVYQMVKLVVIVLGSLVCLAILINKSPITVIAGLGASAAILSLVFKDTILGFVAGIQLSANNMLHEGDWIVAPKFDADGDVLSIGLNTIKVRNWDKTVTTIPTYALITQSFQNWERMRDFGARRVKRHFYVDATTVRFMRADEVAQLRADGFVTADDLAGSDAAVVNLRLFRCYMERYLANHPQVSAADGTTTMVRQLQPTSAGLPVELYFFTSTTEWVTYEHIQADIFDHLYATVSLFGLRVYQLPAGSDLAAVQGYGREGHKA